MSESQWRLDPIHLGIDQKTNDLLRMFHVELLRFNKSLNLISRNTEADSDLIHILDGVLGSRIVSEDLLNVDSSVEILDIGSGNGVPGIVFAILFPRRHIRAIEIDQRKCEFLKTARVRLKLPNFEVFNVNLESISDGTIRAAISRGFAPIDRSIAEFGKKFGKNGTWYHLKGPEWSSESQDCSTWNIRKIGEYSIPQLNRQRVVVKCSND